MSDKNGGHSNAEIRALNEVCNELRAAGRLDRKTTPHSELMRLVKIREKELLEKWPELARCE
ncbi:hypothetical protein [Candidatus Methanoperedens nitratireducens]|uniref:Uncharacterized protein n=1 Tax=Candidatus Methanoperedens nitratireducens TaxID=1392998 RepID=A0A284VNM0_9EURY|nr:hypothetical protein [Candidatus Methanoperedens nitroreducens]SNQ60864.1 hypothetical protein MNV_2060006 [Candidatus Methanoperedens nitroreducens]